jgi:hypothetical protein
MMRTGIATVTLAAIVLAHLATLLPVRAQPTGQPPAAADTPAAQPAQAPSPPTSSAPAPVPAAPPSPAPRPAVVSPSASAPAVARRPSRDEVSAAREACRQQANARDLIGSERAKFLRGCFGAKMPAVVKRNTCRKEGKAKGHAQAALRAYIRQCMRGRG